MADLFTGEPIPVGEKVKELQREVRYRQFVYARLVADGKLEEGLAKRRIAIIEAVIEDYQLGKVGQ